MHKTPQENFWAEEFGDDYILRNESPSLLASKTAMFANILAKTSGVDSAVEFGCNIGINLAAISHLRPNVQIHAVEINSQAAGICRKRLPEAKITLGSIFDYTPEKPCELAFTCGVMIHLNPEMLPKTYERLAAASSRYVMIAEYYNPNPVSIPYRGHEDRLFKRDFAREFIEGHPEYKLIAYNFVYRDDPTFPLDDITWFLMEK